MPAKSTTELRPAWRTIVEGGYERAAEQALKLLANQKALLAREHTAMEWQEALRLARRAQFSRWLDMQAIQAAEERAERECRQHVLPESVPAEAVASRQWTRTSPAFQPNFQSRITCWVCGRSAMTSPCFDCRGILDDE
jgi:hypothetical protein